MGNITEWRILLPECIIVWMLDKIVPGWHLLMKIFIIQGALIGVIGTLFGVVGGVLIAWNVDVVVPAIERLIGVQFLAKDVYYISDLPSDPNLKDVIVIALTSFALSLAATLYPSLRAARVNPAEALRYE